MAADVEATVEYDLLNGFAYDALPEQVQPVGRSFYLCAKQCAEMEAENEVDRVKALWSLLDARNLAVRAVRRDQ